MIYWLTHVVSRLWCGAHFAIHVEGLDRIPESGPGILVVNHPCAIDGILMVGLIHRTVHSYTRAANSRNALTALYLRLIGSRTVQSGGDNRSASALAAAALRDGHLFGIFAEGDVSMGPMPGPFRPGFMKLAVTTGAPVIPVAIAGTPPALRDPRRPSMLDLLFMRR